MWRPLQKRMQMLVMARHCWQQQQHRSRGGTWVSRKIVWIVMRCEHHYSSWSKAVVPDWMRSTDAPMLVARMLVSAESLCCRLLRLCQMLEWPRMKRCDSMVVGMPHWYAGRRANDRAKGTPWRTRKKRQQRIRTASIVGSDAARR